LCVTRPNAAAAQGGSDILMSMHTSGDLAAALAKLKK
jgi:glutaredoxin-related protein